MFLSDNFICFLKENFKASANDALFSKLCDGNLRLNEWYASILRMAAYKNRLDIVKELFSYADKIKLAKQNFINIQDKKRGNTAILIAASMNHTTVFSYLVEMGACVYLSNDQLHTPLSIAYKKEQKQILESFFQSGTPLSYYSEFGYSILETALKNQEIEFAQFLMAKGLNIHQPMKCPENGYWHDNVPYYEESLTPLVRAIKSQNFKLARLLIKIGANINIPSEYDVTPFRSLLELITSPDNEGSNSQVLALLTLVLSHKTFVFTKPSDTDYALSDFMCALLAILKPEFEGQYSVLYEMFPLILSKCPDINALQECYEKDKPRNKRPPLELALNFGSLKIVNDLLTNGANLYSVLGNIQQYWKERLCTYYLDDAKERKWYLQKLPTCPSDPEKQWELESEYRGRLADITRHGFDPWFQKNKQLAPILTTATEKLQETLQETVPLLPDVLTIVMTYAYNPPPQLNWEQALDKEQKDFWKHRQELRDNPTYDVNAQCDRVFRW